MTRLRALLLVLPALLACDSSNPVAPETPPPPPGGGFQPIQGEIEITFPGIDQAQPYAGGPTVQITVRVDDLTEEEFGSEIGLTASSGTFRQSGTSQVTLAHCQATSCTEEVDFVPGGSAGSAQLVATYKSEVQQVSLEILDPGPAPEADFSTESNGLVVIFTDSSKGTIVDRTWRFQDCGSSADCGRVDGQPRAECRRGQCTIRCGDGPSQDACTADYINPIYEYDLPGSYQVELEIVNPIDEFSAKATFLDVQASPPEAGFDSESTDLTVIFTDQSTGTIRTRRWEFQDCGSTSQCNPGENPGVGCFGGRCTLECDDGDRGAANDCVPDITDPVYTYLTGGDYVVSLTVGNDMGEDVAQKFLAIGSDDPPVADFEFELTEGLEVFFLDKSTGQIDDWAWDFGDGTSGPEADDRNPVHEYAEAGNYLVTLRVSNGEGEEDSKAQLLRVADVPDARFTAGVTSACNVGFTDQSEGSPTEWKWSDSVDTLSSSSQNPSQDYAGVAQQGTGCTPADGVLCIRTVRVTLKATSEVGTGECRDDFSLQEAFKDDGGDIVSDGCSFNRLTRDCAP